MIRIEVERVKDRRWILTLLINFYREIINWTIRFITNFWIYSILWIKSYCIYSSVWKRLTSFYTASHFFFFFFFVVTEQVKRKSEWKEKLNNVLFYSVCSVKIITVTLHFTILFTKMRENQNKSLRNNILYIIYEIFFKYSGKDTTLSCFVTCLINMKIVER
jgi:hypothetical protein